MRPFPSTDLGRAVFASGLPVRKAKCLFTALKGARGSFDSTTHPLQLLWAVLQGIDNDLQISNWSMWKMLCNRYFTAEYMKLAGVPTGGSIQLCCHTQPCLWHASLTSQATLYSHTVTRTKVKTTLCEVEYRNVDTCIEFNPKLRIKFRLSRSVHVRIHSISEAELLEIFSLHLCLILVRSMPL